MLLVGLGAVATTTIAGVCAIRKGLAPPIGSLTQMGTIRLGARSDDNVPLIRDYVPLAGLDDLVADQPAFRAVAFQSPLRLDRLARDAAPPIVQS